MDRAGIVELWTKIQNQLLQKADQAQLNDYATNADMYRTITTALGEYLTTDEADLAIATAIEASDHITLSYVKELPAIGQENIIYLVSLANNLDCTSEAYFWHNGEWTLAGNRHSNPNLLINWYFVTPINQRKQTEYTAQRLMYTIDMWRLHQQGGSYDVTTSTMTFNALDWTGIGTTVEWNAEYPSQTVTASMLYSSEADTELTLYYEGVNRSNNIIIPAHEMGVYSITATVPEGTTGIEVQLNHDRHSNPVGNAIIVAAKLEVSTVQTLAHKEGDEWMLNDPPPNRASELAKCQRYQVVFNGSDANQPLLAPGYTTNATTARFLLDLPGPLRATPTISVSNLYVNLSGVRFPVTATAVLGPPAQNKVNIQVTCSSANFAANQPCFLEGQGDYRLLLDANL